MITQDFISQLWQQQSHVIRSFLDMRPRYEKLCEEVAYIMSQQLHACGIEYAATAFRVKTLESFCEKIARKGYKHPLKEATDLAGVRIVYLYLSDRPALENIVEREFKVIEKADKIEKADPDRFGYGALHYLIRLGNKSSGARYDDLKELTCELQVRTVLQDAWSMVAHNLSYKQESDVPRELRRKLNALSGLFETADSSFDQLRKERLEYKERVKNEMSKENRAFLQREIDLDNLTEYLSWRLPDRGQSEQEDIADLLEELRKYGYTRLAQLDNAMNKTEDAIKAFEEKYPPFDIETYEEDGPYNQVGAVRMALCFTDDEYLEKKHSSSGHFDEFKSLVKN